MPPALSRRNALGLLSTAPLAAGIFAGQRALTASAQDLTPLRVGAIPIDPCGALFYALEFGSFAKVGLDVKLQMMNNGSSIAAGVASGALDVGLADLPSAASGFAHGLPFTYVAPAAVYTPQAPGHALFVKKNSPILAAKDFAGKTIAVNGIHAIDQVTTQAWIDKNGGDWRAVKFVEMPYPTMAAALDSDAVDAIVITEPGWTLTNGRFRGFELGDGGVADRFLISGYVAMRDWANAHADIVHKFAAVIRDAGRWGNANHAASAAILAKNSKIAPEVLTKMKRSFYGDRLTPALLQPLIDASVKYGAVSKSFPAAEIIFS